MNAIVFAAAMLASGPTLGMAAGQCRPAEQGPAILVEVDGLKDRRGRLRLELYPANETDFLADDNVLIAAGKTFARVDVPAPPEGPAMLCIRVPRPGRYALSFLHDRDGDHRFSLATDGIGFASNPKLGWSKPHASAASLDVGTGISRIVIIPEYLHGLAFRAEARR